MDFTQLNLSDVIIKSLAKEKITKPTKIQQEVYNALYEGKNVLAQSQTGSGKTLAYLLPFMQKYIDTTEGNKVLILVPTHELAMQVVRQIRTTNENAGLSLKTASVVGDVNIRRQLESLKKRPQFIVGTPGRVLELIRKRKISAHLLESVILDEADKLLAPNQIEETKAVIKSCLRDIQKSFFSASMNEDAKAAAAEIAGQYELFLADNQLKVPDNLEHMYIVCDGREKTDTLRSIISALKPKKAIVFINKVYDIEKATEKLKYHHYDVMCIHGNTKAADRKRAVEMFSKGKLQILIGTDLAARGLHFNNVDLIIHYSIPEDEKDYLHRAGRCARGGEHGTNISIVTPAEIKRIKSFERKLSLKITEKRLSNGKMIKAAASNKENNNRTDKPAKSNKSYKAHARAGKSVKTDNEINKNDRLNSKSNNTVKTGKTVKSNKKFGLKGTDNKNNKNNKKYKNSY